VITKATIKRIRSLQHKKFRQENKLFIAEGEKIVNDLIIGEKNTVPYEVHSIFHTNQWNPPVSIINKQHLNFELIQYSELKQISFLSSPNKVLALVRIPEIELDQKELSDDLSLVLDSIRDPGNLGTIIRIAHWYGIRNIICSRDSVDMYNPKTVQSTMGSIWSVKIFYRDLSAFIPELLTEIKAPVYGTDIEGSNIYKLNLTNNGLILLGNESQGISEGLSSHIDVKLCIPSLSPTFKPDSLNVAHAAAVICSEFRRSKMKDKE